MPIRAVIFDFIGTLVDVKGYDLEISKMKLYRALCEAGFKVGHEKFLEAYTQAHEKYRVIRYQKLVEVTNAIWISEALNSLGFETVPEDSRIKVAVNLFFEDYLNSLKMRKCAKKLLRKLSTENYKLGLISNFTYAPLIYAALRKMGITHFFNAVLISADIGWRKPHPKIFEEALKKLQVRAEEAIYIGDSPDEDIKGAKQLGVKTIHVSSRFYPPEALLKSMQNPDDRAKNLCEAGEKLQKILFIYSRS
ncbi:MAG: HAD family hydrolase [Nitrososphaerota archaeon]|nr:HAD family hydrolase [Candidatus Bathyarchaeota archaeon]MDW8022275.1 HAD family hydrolase [Nitrososphaerota archaeon]